MTTSETTRKSIIKEIESVGAPGCAIAWIDRIAGRRGAWLEARGSGRPRLGITKGEARRKTSKSSLSDRHT